MIVRVDHKIRIALSDLPPDVLNSITEALSIPNIEREKAMKQNIWGWRSMPEVIKLYEICNRQVGMTPDLVMPRGFWSNLMYGLEHVGIEPEIQDEMYFESILPMSDPIKLNVWQMKAITAMQIFKQGIWKAPAGSGKTVGILELARRLKTPSIVLVNTKDILYQWERRAKFFLGPDFPVGIIGDDRFEISDYLTIATSQTIHRRFEKLEAQGFFDDTFGFVCLDECHHATAYTYNRILNRFNAAYRVGVSATPDKTGDFELAKNVLGPIIHETRADDVDTIIKPYIFKIVTNFEYNYQKRSDYSKLINEIVVDPWRNALIIKTILMNPGSHSLVVSKRLEHLRIIEEGLRRLKYPYPIFQLTGAESSNERVKIVDQATRYPCIVLSTLADEALDIPRLDSIFLVYPQRNIGLIEQQIGRVCRQHPDKIQANVYDFADINVGPCEAQWRVRRRDLYQPADYDIEVVTAKEIMDYDIMNYEQ